MSSLTPATLDPGEALERMALQQLAFAYCHAIDRRDLQVVFQPKVDPVSGDVVGA